MTKFKLSHRLVSDMYIFEAGSWYIMGDDFLCDPTVENLNKVIKEYCEDTEYNNPSFQELKIELK